MKEKDQYVRDLKEGVLIKAPFLVKHSAVQVGKTGKPYMNVVFCDKTGELEGRIWDRVSDYANLAVQNAFVMVEGNCKSFQGRLQVTVKKLEVLREDQVKVEDYLKESRVDSEALYEELKGFVSSMKDPYYRALAESVLIDDEEIVGKMKRAPAAKTIHHAYRGGLLEHIISITKTLDFMAAHYAPYVDRDLLFLGGFFHDIGKIWELSYDKVTDYTDEGRLIGHLVMGVELVNRKFAELESQEGRLHGPFPEDQKLLVKHVILAHHGKLEFGSPKRPKCLEALIVHHIDDLDSKINTIQCFTSDDPSPGKWTTLNRQYERFFYKPSWAHETEPK